MKVAPATSGERPRAENGNVKISFKGLFRKYLKIFFRKYLKRKCFRKFPEKIFQRHFLNAQEMKQKIIYLRTRSLGARWAPTSRPVGHPDPRTHQPQPPTPDPGRLWALFLSLPLAAQRSAQRYERTE